MFEADNEIIKNINKLNKELREKYSDCILFDGDELRELISKKLGKIKKIERLGRDELEEYEKKGGIVGVDGSVNKKGSSYPHYIELFKGLAKSTREREPISLVEINSPLMNSSSSSMSDDERELEALNDRNRVLANIEMAVALESVRRHKPYAILLDGSLLRYHIYSKELWMELSETCEEEGILLLGVIEEVKTQIISQALGEEEDGRMIYDRELLFGRLDYGELILIDDEVNSKREWNDKKGKESINISSAFLRSSLAPNVIGIDILGSQKESLEEMARLVLSLTPENSRGIPLWLDLVDEEVKISNNMLEQYLENYLDRDIYERFFVEIRSKRN